MVNKDDYYKCNKEKPTQALEDGDSIFKFDRSGPFFFISGHGDNCEKGQKLIIIVLAVRNNTHKSPSPMSVEPEHLPVDAPAHAPAPAPAASAALGGSGSYLLGLSCVIWGCFFGLMQA